jgi:hypothetical protein
MQRPLGLILIVIWYAIVGAGQTIGAGRLLLATLPMSPRPAPMQWAMAATDAVIGALSLVCAYGLWRRRPWGRHLTIGLAAAIAAAIVAFWLLTAAAIGPPLIAVLLFLVGVYLVQFGVCLAVVGYLLRPQARELFSEAPS